MTVLQHKMCLVLVAFVLLLSPAVLSAQVSQDIFSEPLSFQPNLGQDPASVRFTSSNSNYKLAVTDGAATISLKGDQTSAVRMTLPGSKTPSRVYGSDALPIRNNYYLGSDSSRWVTNVPAYGKVHLNDVYSGVDLVYYGNGREVEYDFVAAPGSNPHAIEMAFEGARSIQPAPNGELKLTVGNSHLMLRRPVAYQQVGTRRTVAASYVVQSNGNIRFQLGAYDPSLPLTIDPTIAFFEFLGGGTGSTGMGRGVTVSASGIVYVVGDDASGHVFLKRFDPSCVSPCTSRWTTTTLTANGVDTGKSIAQDASGNLWIVGSTTSTNFPTTTGALQTTIGSASSPDAFIAKFDSSAGLLYSTYFGGPGVDIGDSIAVSTCNGGASTCVFIAGLTGSNLSALNLNTGGILRLLNLLTTIVGSLTNPSIGNDGFVLKMIATGNSLSFASTNGLTYLGPVAARGYATQTDLPVASDSGSTSLAVAAAVDDAIVAGAKYSPSGSNTNAFVWRVGTTTYTRSLQTVTTENRKNSFANAVAVDALGNAHVVGETSATSFPYVCTGTSGQFCQSTLSQPSSSIVDAFYAQLSSTGGVTYGTYMGSGDASTSAKTDTASSVAVDTAGDILIGGTAGAASFLNGEGSPLTFSGSSDGFVAAFSPLHALLTASFIRPTSSSATQHQVSALALFSNNDVLALGSSVSGTPMGPWVAKVGAPLIKVAGFSSFKITLVDTTQPACPATIINAVCYYSDQNPTLTPPIAIATVTAKLSLALPAGQNLLTQFGETNTNLEIVNLQTTDRITWTFTVNYKMAVSPGLNSFTLKVAIDPGGANSLQQCATNDTRCSSLLTIIGIPAIQQILFANNATVVGGNPTTGQVKLGQAVYKPVTVFLNTCADANCTTPDAFAGVPTTTVVNGTSTGPTDFSNPFTITTSQVNGIHPVQIRASYTGLGDAFRSDVVTLLPDLRVDPLSLALTPTTLPSGVFSGSSITANVGLANNASVPDDPIYAAGITFHIIKVVSGTEIELASGTIGRGQSTGSVTFAAENVTATTTFTVRARIDAGPLTNLSYANPISMIVNPVALQVIDFGSVTSSVGGVAVSGVIRVNAPAPTGGLQVSLSAAGGTVPAFVNVPAGSQVSDSFQFTPTAVSAATNAVVTATLNQSIKTFTMPILAPTPATLTLSSNTVPVNGTITATVTLNGPAPAPTGIVVPVVTSFGTFNITVPAGQTSATGTITAPATANTYTVAANPAPTQTLTVTSTNRITGLTAPATVPSGSTIPVTVTLSGAAPAGGTTVYITVPWSASPVTLTINGAATGTVNLTPPKVTTAVDYTIYAGLTAGGRDASASFTETLQVTQITITPSPLTAGGPMSVKVDLDGVPSNTVTVLLQLDGTSLASINTVTNTGTASGLTAPAVGTHTLKATLNGTPTTITFTVNAAPTPTLTLTPASVASGGSTVAKVTLNQPAAFDMTFALTTNIPGVTLAPIVVPTGSTTGTTTTTITAPKVTGPSTYTVTATSGSATSTATLSVSLQAGQLTVSPTTVVSGGTVTATITLNGPAGAAITVPVTGLPVALSIPVAANASTGSVTFTAPAAGAYTLTATFNGTATATLQVNPVTTGVTFSKFNIDVAVGQHWGDDQDTFRVKGKFSLGNGSNGINPVTEIVSLRVGPYSVTIPANKFVVSGDKDDDGDIDDHGCHVVKRYRFQGTINGAVLDIRIRYFGNNEYELRAYGRRLDMTGVIKGQPITVALAIGDDNGTAVDTTPKTRIKGMVDAQVDIDLDKKAGSDTFAIHADFILDDDTRVVNPVTQDVTIAFAGYSITIPANSFKVQSDWWRGTRTFTFNGRVVGSNDDTFQIQLRDLGHDIWDLDASGKNLDLDAIDGNNPLTIALTVGQVMGEATDNSPKVH